MRGPLLKLVSLRIACTTLEPSQFPNSPWSEIAVSGRSNVGKSSLLNTLFERKNLARISNDPGKTRTVNFYAVNDRFYLVDLPGYGYARVAAAARQQWARTIRSYIEGRETLRGVVQLIDSRHAPSEEDRVTSVRLIENGRPFIVVFTKADKISRSERSRVVREFNESLEGTGLAVRVAPKGPPLGGRDETVAAPESTALFFSAKTGEGREELWRWISERI